MSIIKTNKVLVDNSAYQIGETVLGTTGISGGISLKKNESYVTPEIRAYKSMYGDPLSLCFKFMIDYDKPYGLFAPADCVDSALAYVARIEQNGVQSVRYQALQNWIDNFKMLIQYYDFLMLEIEGLEMILNVGPQTSFNDTENRIQIKLRETIDMRVQNIIDGYRHIIYDDIRMVEVIPINLRRFDCHVLVYSTGYYNMALYSLTGGKETVMVDGKETSKDLDEGTIRMVLPTIDKLNENSIFNWNVSSFNNICFNMEDCQFIVEESGKDLFSTVSNEMSGEFAKNNICFGYHFADYKGIFNNTRGEIDLMSALAMSAAQDRASSSIASSTVSNSQTPTKQELRDAKKAERNKKSQDLKVKSKQYFNDIGEEMKSQGAGLWETLKPSSLWKDIKNKTLSKSLPIGNAFSKVTNAGFVSGMIKNTIDLGLSKVEDKYINGNIAKLNNLMGMNFSDNLYSIYKNYFDSKVQNKTGNVALGVMENPIKQQSEATTTNFGNSNTVKIDNGIKLMGVENIYNRKGF